MTTYCVYTKTAQDGYGADWKTACGHELRMESTIEVGFSFPPLPNDDGHVFCCFCGNKISLVEQR